MKLDHHIIQAVREYPTLYKATTWEFSKLLVLHHLFLVNGNGYSWHDGYLTTAYDEDFRSYGAEIARRLPKGFFTKRVHKLKPWKKKDAEMWLGFEEIVESLDLTEDMIKDLNAHTKRIKKNLVKRGNRYYEKQYQDCAAPGSRYDITPYPICQFAKLVTMPDDVRPDWLEGAHIIADYAIDYFTDESKYQSHYQYPNEKRISVTTSDWARKEKEGRFKECVIDIWGALPGETPEEYCNRKWPPFVAEQLKYLNDFKEKFNNEFVRSGESRK